MASEPQQQLRGTSRESLDDAIKQAVRGRRPGPRTEYKVTETVVETIHVNPGVVDVYRVRLDKI